MHFPTILADVKWVVIEAGAIGLRQERDLNQRGLGGPLAVGPDANCPRRRRLAVRETEQTAGRCVAKREWMLAESNQHADIQPMSFQVNDHLDSLTAHQASRGVAAELGTQQRNMPVRV